MYLMPSSESIFQIVNAAIDKNNGIKPFSGNFYRETFSCFFPDFMPWEFDDNRDDTDVAG